MFKSIKVISTAVLICFSFNAILADITFGQTTNFRAKTSDKLATALMCDDLAGIEHKDIGRIKYHLETMLLSNAIPSSNTKIHEESKFDPAEMQFFYHEPIRIGEYTGIKVLIKDSEGHRTYYGLYKEERDNDNGFPIYIYTEKEYKAFESSGMLEKALPVRKDADRNAIDMYIQNERIIDKWIAKHMESEDNHISFTPGENDILPYITSNEFATLDHLLDGLPSYLLSTRRTVIIKVKASEKRPVIYIDGKPIKVNSHTSNNSEYVFVDESIFNEFNNFVAKVRSGLEFLPSSDDATVQMLTTMTFRFLEPCLVHDIGAMCGLPYKIHDGILVNDMDTLLDWIIIAPTVDSAKIRQLAASIKPRLKDVDLDYLRGEKGEYDRDHASGESPDAVRGHTEGWSEESLVDYVMKESGGVFAANLILNELYTENRPKFGRFVELLRQRFFRGDVPADLGLTPSLMEKTVAELRGENGAAWRDGAAAARAGRGFANVFSGPVDLNKMQELSKTVKAMKPTDVHVKGAHRIQLALMNGGFKDIFVVVRERAKVLDAAKDKAKITFSATSNMSDIGAESWYKQTYSETSWNRFTASPVQIFARNDDDQIIIIEHDLRNIDDNVAAVRGKTWHWKVRIVSADGKSEVTGSDLENFISLLTTPLQVLLEWALNTERKQPGIFNAGEIASFIGKEALPTDLRTEKMIPYSGELKERNATEEALVGFFSRNTNIWKEYRKYFVDRTVGPLGRFAASTHKIADQPDDSKANEVTEFFSNIFSGNPNLLSLPMALPQAVRSVSPEIVNPANSHMVLLALMDAGFSDACVVVRKRKQNHGVFGPADTTPISFSGATGDTSISDENGYPAEFNGLKYFRYTATPVQIFAKDMDGNILILERALMGLDDHAAAAQSCTNQWEVRLVSRGGDIARNNELLSRVAKQLKLSRGRFLISIMESGIVSPKEVIKLIDKMILPRYIDNDDLSYYNEAFPYEYRVEQALVEFFRVRPNILELYRDYLCAPSSEYERKHDPLATFMREAVQRDIETTRGGLGKYFAGKGGIGVSKPGEIASGGESSARVKQRAHYSDVEELVNYVMGDGLGGRVLELIMDELIMSREVTKFDQFMALLTQRLLDGGFPEDAEVLTVILNALVPNLENNVRQSATAAAQKLSKNPFWDLLRTPEQERVTEVLSAEDVNNTIALIRGSVTDLQKSIPTHKDTRYTVLVPFEFFADRQETQRDQNHYADRFDLDAISARSANEFIRNVLTNVKTRKDRTIVLLPDQTASDKFKDEHFKALKDAGIRFMIVNRVDLMSANTDKDEYRTKFQQDTYAVMLLMRSIDEKTEASSPIYRLLSFYLKTHFDLSNVAIDDYIMAITKNEISKLIQGILKYRPAKPYDKTELGYDKVAATLLSA